CVTLSHVSETLDSNRLPVGDLELREMRQPLSALDRRRHERYPGRDCDPGGARPWPVLELLHQALRLSSPLRKHGDDLALAAEPNGRLDRLDVAPAPVDGKGSAGAERWAEYGVEELDLGHEVELSTRPERETERPGIEVRRVVGTENEASLLRKVLEPFCANPKE